MGVALAPVAALPHALRDRIAGRDLIVFDGTCVLCSGFFRFVLRHDRDRRFSFASAQSPFGTALYHALGMPTDDYDTNLVLVDGGVYGHLDAFAVAMASLSWPWRVLYLLRFLPRAVKMPIYRLIARNRYRVFGRSDTCMMPDADVRARFVQGGF